MANNLYDFLNKAIPMQSSDSLWQASFFNNIQRISYYNIKAKELPKAFFKEIYMKKIKLHSIIMQYTWLHPENAKFENIYTDKTCIRKKNVKYWSRILIYLPYQEILYFFNLHIDI